MLRNYMRSFQQYFLVQCSDVHCDFHIKMMFGSSLPAEGTLMSYCTVFCEVRFLFTYRRNAHVLLYCVLWSSVPLDLQKERSCLIVLRCVKFGSSLPTEGTLMSYCAALCEVRFLFTHRRNAHVLLYCVLWSSVPLYPQKERSCAIVLWFVKFGSSLPTEGTLMSYCTAFCEVRFLFTHRRNAHVLLYCGLWSSVPLYLQKERSCLIVLCFVMFGSSLPPEGTLMSYCTVCLRLVYYVPNVASFFWIGHS